MFGWFRKKQKPGPTTTTQAEVPLPAPATPIDIPHDKIVARAYEIWVRKGKPHGQDFENWMEAETELRTEFAEQTGHEPRPRKPR